MYHKKFLQYTVLTANDSVPWGYLVWYTNQWRCVQFWAWMPNVLNSTLVLRVQNPATNCYVFAVSNGVMVCIMTSDMSNSNINGFSRNFTFWYLTNYAYLLATIRIPNFLWENRKFSLYQRYFFLKIHIWRNDPVKWSVPCSLWRPIAICTLYNSYLTTALVFNVLAILIDSILASTVCS